MKKFFLLALTLLIVPLTMLAQQVTVVSDVTSYTGTDAYVFNLKDNKHYVRNNLGQYERYGVYVKTNTLNIADPSATPKVIDYIATDNDHKTYINTGYVHTTQTRVVADFEINEAADSYDGWRAVFGSRTGFAEKALVYFYHYDNSRRGCFTLGNKEKKGANPGTNALDRNIRYILDANSVTKKVTVTPKEGATDGNTSIIDNSDATPQAGQHPLFIFDLATASDGHADGSKARMKLYSFKIYEGNELVRDYEPIVNSEGKGGLHEKLTDTYLYSADEAVDFLLSPDAAEKLTPGIPVYTGKMVLNTTDGKVYKYDGTQFVLSGDGNRTLTEIASTDYKNLNNWVTNNDHKAIFEGKWQTTANGYKIQPYEGTGGHEPLMTRVPLEVGADYNYSFTASWGAYGSWHGVEMHAYVCNFWDLGTTESGLSVSGSVLATQTFAFAGGTDVPFSLDFTADRADQTLLFQFGDIDDGGHNPAFWFEFDNLSVKKYVYPETYPRLSDPIVSATIELAKAEGINTEEAEAYLENGSGDRDLILYRLRAERKLKAAQQYKLDPAKVAGSVPADNGDYYLLNVGTGLFLNTTADWGSHISIDNPGMLIHLSQDGTGGNGLPAFHISGNGWSGLNWSEEYWDKNGEHKSAFRPVDGKENVYYWNVFDNFGWHFVYDVKDGTTDGQRFWNAVKKRNKPTADYANDLNAQWKLVSAADLQTAMLNASEEEPMDVTFLINNPNFTKAKDQQIGRGWTGVGGVMSGDRDYFYVIEYFQSNINLKQTLNNLPPGKYQVSVSGFFRDGTTDNETAKKNNGEQLKQLARLVAINSSGDCVEALLPNPSSEAGHMPGVGDVVNGLELANWAWQANEYFQTGLYQTHTETIFSDGTLTIGIEDTNDGTQGNWVVVDNFRLTYLGGLSLEASVEALESTIDAAQLVDPDKLTGKMLNDLHDAIAEASALTSSSDVSTVFVANNKLSEFLAKVQSMDVRLLRATVREAEKDGVETPEASDFLLNGEDPTKVDNLLYVARAQRKLHAAEQFKIDADKVKGSTPVEGGEYYVLNAGTGLFLNTTADWGTHISIDNTPMQVKMGQYFTGFDGLPAFRMSGNGWNGLSNGEYWDKNGEMKFAFNPSHSETYYLNDADNKNVHFVYDVKDGTTDGQRFWNAVKKRNRDFDDYYQDANAHWKLVTRDQLKASLAQASDSNPMDATFLINNPNFTKVNNQNTARGWTGVGGVMGGDRDAFYVVEFYEKSADMKQTLEGLPAGNYRVSVNGFYRDGSTDSETNRYKNGGSFAQDAFLVAINGANETVRQPLPNVSSEAGRMPGVGDVVNDVELANWPWQANEYFQTGLYLTTTQTIFVGTDGKLTIGIEKANAGDPAQNWVVVDNFRLTYLGADAETFKSSLEKLIDEAELFNGETTDALETGLATAIANAKAALTSTDFNEVATCLDNLTTALNKARTVDTAVLSRVMELLKQKDADYDVSRAEKFLVSGTDVDEYNELLNTLRVARKVLSIEQDPGHFEGNEPAAGEYYLYNVGRKAYLTSGSDWGTHAALGFPGLLATLSGSGNSYTIQFTELIQGDARDRYLGGSPYVDCATDGRDTYTFEAVSGKPGVYAIHGSRGYLAFDPNGEVDGGGVKHFNTVTATWETPGNTDAEWMLVSAADRLAQLEGASTARPADVSFLIRDASFNKYAAKDNPWSGLNQGWGWGDRNFGDKNTEAFNVQDYNLSQTVRLPKAGVYELRAQSYYRDGDVDHHVDIVYHNLDLLDPAVLYAATVEQPLKYIHDEADNAPGEGTQTIIGNIPDKMDQAARFFQNGLYWNSLRFKVDADDEAVTIGIRCDSGQNPENWIVTDNFRLVYLGDGDPTGVSDASRDARKPAAVYNLQGVRVDRPSKGVFIIDGRKVVK